MAVRFKDRFSDELHGRLYHAICYWRDAQGAGAALRLRNLDHPDRRELVAVRPECGLELLEQHPFLPGGDNLLDRLGSDSRCPVVGFDLAPGLPQDILPPDFVLQAVNPRLLLLLGLTVKGSLPVPDFVGSLPSQVAIGPPHLR